MNGRTGLAAVLVLALMAASSWAQDERRGERPREREPGAAGEPRRGGPGQEGGGPRGFLGGPGEGEGGIPQPLAEFLKDFDPRGLEDLRRARATEPERFRDMIGRAFDLMRRVERIKRENPQRYQALLRQRELEQQSFELARQIREGEAKQKDVLKGKLKQVLADLFDLREEERDHEISEMTERLERMKETARQRREGKDAIVENRLKEITDENEHLRW
jgi:hypothetical protein